jgi:hypothetical protein
VNRFGPALLRFDVFQRGNGPFGLLYGGSVDVEHTPEEATVALVAAGLAWLWWRQRRQRLAQGSEGRSSLRQAPAPASGR